MLTILYPQEDLSFVDVIIIIIDHNSGTKDVNMPTFMEKFHPLCSSQIVFNEEYHLVKFNVIPL